MSYDEASHQIRDLESQIDDLETDVNALKEKIGYVEDLDYELRDIRNDIEEAESQVTDLEKDVRSHIRETERALKKIGQRLRTLEAHIQFDGSAEADFGTFETTLYELARTADHGRAARTSLLTANQRAKFLDQIHSYQNVLTSRENSRANAVAAAGVLASTSPKATEHKQAAAEFNQAANLTDHYTQRLETLAVQTQSAQAALDKDDELRAAKSDVIDEGDKAEKQLLSMLRNRLYDAVRKRTRPPMWFVTVLGPVPPAEQTQEWVDLATQVLAYRVTYKVKDPVVALGPRPEGCAVHRATWYEDLIEELTRR